jgi:superfamily II DNA/RNA helicase
MDRVVREEDEELTQLLGNSAMKINRIIDTSTQEQIPHFTVESILDQIDSVASGRAKNLYVFSASSKRVAVPVTQEIRAICRRIQRIIRHRLLLFEDMHPNVTFLDPKNLLPENSMRSRKLEYHVLLRNKAVHAVAIVKERKESPGVIFCRNIHTAEALCEYLKKNDLQGDIIHGRVDSTERSQRVASFTEGDQEFLVVTRKLGGRGFDLPQAMYVVFYSPKQDADIMWQEILRIRSMKKLPKDAYILYYKETKEEDKMKRLEKEMAKKPESFLFTSRN